MISPICSSGIFSSYLEEVHDFVRIDRIIQNLYLDPSKENTIPLIEKGVVVLIGISSAAILGPAFGVYLVAMNIFFMAAVNTYLKNADLTKLPSAKTFFSNENPLWKLVLGIIAWFPFAIFENNLEIFINWLMGLMGIVITGTQDVGVLLASSGLTAILWIVLGCLIAPVGEEIVFRGYLEKIFEQSENPSVFQRFTTACKTNAIFGAMHLSPFQGWFNLPIFIACFAMGMAFSLLKEVTGDLWAPSSLHIMNNTVATVALRMA